MNTGRLLSDVFPVLRTSSPAFSKHGMWDAPFTSLDETTASALAVVVVDAQHAGQASPDAANELSLSLLAELEAVERTVGGAELLAAQFLRFWLSIHPLQLAIRAGMLPRAHDWINRAIGFADDPHHVEWLRPLVFTSLAWQFVKLNLTPTLIEWYEALYYYARKAGAHTEMAEDNFRHARLLLRTQLPNDDAVVAALHLLAWAHGRHHVDAPSLARDIEGLLNDPRTSPHSQKMIRIAFATSAGELTSVPLAARAAEVLNVHRNDLIGHERLQMLGAWVAGDIGAAVDETEQIVSAIEENNRFLRPFATAHYARCRRQPRSVVN